MARISLGAVDRESGPALELLNLCQTVTEDGSISDQEIDALKTWLDTHKSEDLPAIGVLAALVTTILEDGRITPAERGELHRTVERVLPADLRAIAMSRRRLATAAAREQAKAAKVAERERRKQEALRDSPIDGANFMVAGVRYEGRDRVVARHARAGDPAFLVRDPRNRYSRNAIEVRLANGQQIGFVPEDIAVGLAPVLDSGALQSAMITKILDRGPTPIPVIDVDLYNRDAQVAGLVRQDQCPAKAADVGPIVPSVIAAYAPPPPAEPAPKGRALSWIGWSLALGVVALVIKGMASA